MNIARWTIAWMGAALAVMLPLRVSVAAGSRTDTAVVEGYAGLLGSPFGAHRRYDGYDGEPVTGAALFHDPERARMEAPWLYSRPDGDVPYALVWRTGRAPDPTTADWVAFAWAANLVTDADSVFRLTAEGAAGPVEILFDAAVSGSLATWRGSGARLDFFRLGTFERPGPGASGWTGMMCLTVPAERVEAGRELTLRIEPAGESPGAAQYVLLRRKDTAGDAGHHLRHAKRADRLMEPFTGLVHASGFGEPDTAPFEVRYPSYRRDAEPGALLYLGPRIRPRGGSASADPEADGPRRIRWRTAPAPVDDEPVHFSWSCVMMGAGNEQLAHFTERERRALRMVLTVGEGRRIVWHTAPAPEAHGAGRIALVWGCAMTGAGNEHAVAAGDTPLRFVLTVGEGGRARRIPFHAAAGPSSRWRDGDLVLGFDAAYETPWGDDVGYMWLSVPAHDALLAPGAPLTLSVSPADDADVRVFFMVFPEACPAYFMNQQI